MSKNNKREKFIATAEKRTQGVITGISKISSLANPSAYEYSEADIKQIAKAINDAVKDMEKKFSTPVEQAKTFKLQ